jgi:Rieske Fe-S protein
MQRRRFLACGGALCACGLITLARAGSGAAAARGEAGAGIPGGGEGPEGAGRRIDVGPLSGFAAEKVYDAWAASHGFFIVRRGDRLFAPSASCTHQGAPLVARKDRILCARHGSAFDAAGEVKKGPASAPLPRSGIALGDRGHVIVDTSLSFPHDRWSEPGSFLDIPAS